MYDSSCLARDIQTLMQIIARDGYNKSEICYTITNEKNLTQQDVLHIRLMELLDENKICDAENLLFDEIDEDNEAYIELALDFYQKINVMSEEELNENDFSRAEILDGIIAVLKKYGVDYTVPPEI